MSQSGVKPFPEAQWVHIKYTAEAVEFFSVNKVSLLTIVREINEFIEAKEKKLQEAKELFKATLEESMGHIMVSLDLIDSLVVAVMRLNGPVDWKQIEKDLVQTITIISEARACRTS